VTLMKIISFIIPSYNSASYLHHAVDSLLVSGEDAEIIIVNDGSKDNTLEIAQSYEKKYPTIIKVINQENGGHGSTINAGLNVAVGTYFKVIDSDDWVDQKHLKTLLQTIKLHQSSKIDIDLYITNFMYEHTSDQTQYERDYSPNFPVGTVFEWHQIKKKFRYSKTMLMHALIYKTKILKDMHFELPRHTFYVDNLVAYTPLPNVKKLFYMKMPLYRYFIGRADQSITLTNITNRYQQQIRVQKAIMDAYRYEDIKKLPKGLQQYMFHFIAAIMGITQMFTVYQDTIERRNDLKALWTHLKQTDIKLYHKLKYRSLNTFVLWMPWKLRGYVMLKGYIYLTKKVKLG
jgi:glycosyltransferase involved in cell wall biosynthesis